MHAAPSALLWYLTHLLAPHAHVEKQRVLETFLKDLSEHATSATYQAHSLETLTQVLCLTRRALHARALHDTVCSFPVVERYTYASHAIDCAYRFSNRLYEDRHLPYDNKREVLRELITTLTRGALDLLKHQGAQERDGIALSPMALNFSILLTTDGFFELRKKCRISRIVLNFSLPEQYVHFLHLHTLLDTARRRYEEHGLLTLALACTERSLVEQEPPPPRRPRL